MGLKSYLKILAISLLILTIEVVVVNSLGALNVGVLGIVLCIIDLVAVVGVMLACKSDVNETKPEENN